MSGSLALLPLRLGVRATALAVRGVREIAERAAGLAGLVSHEDPMPDFGAAPTQVPTRTPPPARPTQTQTTEAPAPVDHADTIDYDTPTPAEPAHVDAGAGAQVHIAEPWDGYPALRAAEVIDRLAEASAEELAAIELYELSSRKRRTVIAAAQRELSRRR